MEIAISESARRWGYLKWKKKQGEEMEIFLKGRKEVRLIFNGADHGIKRVDWQYRRISIGYRWTRMIPEQKKIFKISLQNGALYVECQ